MPPWLVALVLAGPVLSTPPEKELTVEEIVERHLAALGGKDALRAIRTLRKTGTYTYNGIEHPIVSFHKTGRLLREEIDGLQLWGTSRRAGRVVLRGTNGRTHWNRDESRSPEWRAIPAARAAVTLDEADVHGALLDAEAKGHRIELSGQTEIEGSSVYRLKVRLASGLESIWLVDARTFLVRRKELAGPESELDLEQPRAIDYDDYRPVGGVMMPFFVYIEEPLFSREYTFERIELNPPLDDAIFEPAPGAIESPRQDEARPPSSP